MTNFSDFNDFLTSDELKRGEQDTTFRLKLKQSYAELQPFLSKTLELFKDYNETILQPRKPHFVILKKHEALHDGDEKAAFLYRINMLPRTLFASHFNPHTSIGANYIRPTVVTKDDWYLKVALQFDILLKQLSTRDTTLTPHLTWRVWGRMSSPSLITNAVDLTHSEDWGKCYTTLSYQVLNTQEAEHTIKELFMAITPSVLAHNKEVFGVKE